MTFFNVLVSTITSASVLTLAFFIVRVFFKATFEGWLAHQFSRQLEEAKSSLRIVEEQIKADRETQERRFEALKSAALTGMTSRNEVLDRRRIEALERLWHSVIEMEPLKRAARWTQSLKMDAVLAASVTGSGPDAPKLQQFAALLWTTSGLEGYQLPNTPDKERPFIPPLLWSLFSAYRQLLGLPMAQLGVAKEGLGKEMLADTGPLLELAKSVLPAHGQYIDQWGAASIPFLLEQVESRLLDELMRSLDSDDSDAKAVERARQIQRLAERVAAEGDTEIEIPSALQQANVPPPP